MLGASPQMYSSADNIKHTIMQERGNADKSLAHLGDDYEPGVDGDMAEALLQGTLHVRGGAVGEPQGQQAQDVLQVGPLRRLAYRASTVLGIRMHCCRR